jgi:hypothetical protein
MDKTHTFGEGAVMITPDENRRQEIEQALQDQ